MKRSLVPTLAFAVAAGLSSLPAAAQQMLDRVDCATLSGERAIAACTRIIKSGRARGPELAETLVNRGNAYRATKKLDQAIADFAEALRVQPGLPRALLGRGNAYSDRREFDKALAQYEEAARINPKYALAFHNRGLVLMKKGEFGRAIAENTIAIELEPDNAMFWEGRCLSRMIGAIELDDAIADCTRSLRVRRDASAFRTRGFVYLKMGEIEKSIADFDTALLMIPQWDEAHYGRGLAKLLRGDSAGGQADIAAAKAITPDIEKELAFFRLQKPGRTRI